MTLGNGSTIWQVHGPSQAVLGKAEVCAVLRISEATLDRLIREGRFPRGVKLSTQSEQLWSGLDLACVIHLLSRMIPDQPQAEPKDSK